MAILRERSETDSRPSHSRLGPAKVRRGWLQVDYNWMNLFEKLHSSETDNGNHYQKMQPFEKKTVGSIFGDLAYEQALRTAQKIL